MFGFELKSAPRTPSEVYVDSLGIHASYPIQDKTNKFSPYVPSGISLDKFMGARVCVADFHQENKNTTNLHKVETTSRKLNNINRMWNTENFHTTVKIFLEILIKRMWFSSGWLWIRKKKMCTNVDGRWKRGIPMSRLTTFHFIRSSANKHFHSVTFFQWKLPLKCTKRTEGFPRTSRRFHSIVSTTTLVRLISLTKYDSNECLRSRNSNYQRQFQRFADNTL